MQTPGDECLERPHPRKMRLVALTGRELSLHTRLGASLAHYLILQRTTEVSEGFRARQTFSFPSPNPGGIFVCFLGAFTRSGSKGNTEQLLTHRPLPKEVTFTLPQWGTVIRVLGTGRWDLPIDSLWSPSGLSSHNPQGRSPVS